MGCVWIDLFRPRSLCSLVAHPAKAEACVSVIAFMRGADACNSTAGSPGVGEGAPEDIAEVCLRGRLHA